MRYQIGRILKREQVIELTAGNCSQPKRLLGRHLLDGGQMISVYHPEAVKMKLLTKCGEIYEMDMVERQQVFALYLPHQKEFSYQIMADLKNGESIVFQDPYYFHSLITVKEEELFLKGRWLAAYQKMGCHAMNIDGVDGMYFVLWAPGVKRVSLIGEFNGWNGKIYPMNKRKRSSIYELFLPGVKEGDAYKFEIKTMQGEILQVADPYGTAKEYGKEISKVLDISGYVWKDAFWMKSRKHRNRADLPMVIYETSGDSEIDIDKILNDGVTHILIGTNTNERRQAASSLYYGFDSRFVPPFCKGSAEQFRRLTEEAHQKGVGILLEFSMGFLCFERPEINNYLLSNLLYWIREYHIDGFVFEVGEDGSCHEDIAEQAVRMIKNEDTGIILISGEQRGNFSKKRRWLTEREGFDYYRDYSVNESLHAYLAGDEEERKKSHFQLTLPLQKQGLYRALLRLDDKNKNLLYQTSIDKSNQVYYDMLSEIKLSFAFLIGVPGRKIVPDCCDDNRIKQYLHSLLQIYREYPALYECGEEEQNFEWVNGMDAESSVISFIRKSSSDGNRFLFICNFNKKSLSAYRIGVPVYEKYVMISNSDDVEFGGKGYFMEQKPMVIQEPCDFRPYSIKVSLPPESALIFGFGPDFLHMRQRKKERCEQQ